MIQWPITAYCSHVLPVLCVCDHDTDLLDVKAGHGVVDFVCLLCVLLLSVTLVRLFPLYCDISDERKVTNQCQ